MQRERMTSGWQQLAGAVARELTDWRAAHPRATLREIEAAVQEAMSRLQACYLEDLAHASAATDLTQPSERRPRCPECGGALEGRGQQEREVLTPGQGVPLRLRRSYAVCSACQAGLFPPG